MKKALAIIFAILLITSCFAACGGTQQDDTSEEKTLDINLDEVNKGSFSNFAALDLYDNIVDESIFKGKKLTMINIWATFCGPCIGEMPDLERSHQEYADKGLQVIGIACDVVSTDVEFEQDLLATAFDIIDGSGVTFTNLRPSASLEKIKLDEVCRFQKL